MRIEFEQKLITPIEAQVWGPFFDTQLEDLVQRDILVKGGIALEREDVGGAIDVAPLAVELVPVSYTHLDVYKRQLCTWHDPQWRKICGRMQHGTNPMIVEPIE